MPTIQLYIKPNTIGLCFANQTDRDLLWAQLGEQQNCAERFGERTIRFNPAKATASFNIALEAEMQGVFVDKPAKPAPVPPTPPVAITETRVVPTAPAPIEPVAIIPAQPSMVAAAVIEQPTPVLPPPVAQLPPAMIEMPQVGSLSQPLPAVRDMTVVQMPPMEAVQNAPKPPDLRSRAGREWKAKQQAIAR